MRISNLATLLPLLGALGTAGCSNSTSSDQGNNELISHSGSVSKIGVLSIRHGAGNVIDAHATYDGVFAEFTQLASGITNEEFINIYRLPLDSCSIFNLPSDVLISPASSITTYHFDSSLKGTPISAGEVISVASAAGTWLDVLRNNEPSGGIYYVNSSEIVEPIPTQLSITVPGDEYPAYSIDLVPSVEPLTLLAPNENAILARDTQFRWLPVNRNDTYVRMTAQKLIGTNMFYLDCMAVDDGEFNIPEQIQQELGTLFNDYTVSYSRVAYYLESNKDSAFLLMRSSGTN